MMQVKLYHFPSVISRFRTLFVFLFAPDFICTIAIQRYAGSQITANFIHQFG